MPDHGVRLPPYDVASGAGILGHSPYGWTGTPPYRAELLPNSSYFPSEAFAYERIDYDEFKKTLRTLQGSSIQPDFYSNPPFLAAGQMLGPAGPPEWMKIAGGSGQFRRILRGFIRLETQEPSSPSSYVRLNFMWNPDELKRNYVSLTDPSDTLDPTDIMGQNAAIEGGLATPADGLVNISFSLFFDRQTEVALVKDHPGVLIDLQTFDAIGGKILGRGTTGYFKASQPPPDGFIGPIVPGTMTGVGANDPMSPEVVDQLAGSLFLGPARIVAVFSPNLAFTGQLTGAEATFTKFSHRMTPTAMMLSINMQLSKIGRSSATVNNAVGGTGSGDARAYNPTVPGFVTPATSAAVATANASGGPAAIAFGRSAAMMGTPYQRNYNRRMDGPPCNTRTPTSSDCSSFVWRCYAHAGWTELLGLGKCDENSHAQNTDGFINVIKSNPGVWQSVNLHNASIEQKKQVVAGLKPGDIFVRGWSGGKAGHIVMFAGTSDGGAPSYDSTNCKKLHSTPEKVKEDTVTGLSLASGFSYWARPVPFRGGGTATGTRRAV